MKILLTLLSIFLINSASSSEKLDQYGGWKEKKFVANGFFKTHHDGTRWWLVTPEGHAFLSLGINHYHSGLWKKSYNKQTWIEKFGANQEWGKKFFEFVKESSDHISVNTMGYHNEDHNILSNPRFKPYIAQYTPLKISFHLRPSASAYVDVFSEKYRQLCIQAVEKQVKPYVNDKYLLGYAMSDVPAFTDRASKMASLYTGKDMPGWSRAIRNLGGAAAGKKAYLSFIKTRYETVKEFNQVYKTSFNTWDELLNAANWKPKTDYSNSKELTDNKDFAMICLDQYYKVAKEEFRKVDKNHLFFGDKLNGNTSPDDIKSILAVSSKYTDCLFIQAYGKAEWQKSWHNMWKSVANLPIINGDGGFGAFGDEKNMPNPQKPAAKNQNERAAWFKSYAQMSFNHPNFVGWHICGIIDSWKQGANQHGIQKPGLMNPHGEYHLEIINAMKEIAAELYSFTK